ncbi:MAG: SDR family NAD(P)-dependent oxidoreductase [Myxococcota bacterium]|nr:SDR family NAD(P)-dependent oxidoreductase [Myxococcota bacterium]
MTNETISLAGKVALVTGAGGGIGRSIAESFASLGAQVALLDRHAGRLAETGSAFAEKGWDPLLIEADVREAESAASAMEAIETRYGRLDVLVNNVGSTLGLMKPFEKMTDADFDALYSVLLKHVFVYTREAIPLMRRSGPGSIINVSSIEGYRGLPNLAPYAAFKLGLEGFTKSLALELGKDRIRVNTIAPETTESHTIRPSEWVASENKERVEEWVPLGRFGRPEDTAGCAVFLASELSGWVSGTTLHCDGGTLAAAGWYRTRDGLWTNTPLIEGSGIGV